MSPAVCCVCGEPLTTENLGALIPEEKAYCEKCKMKAVDDYADWWTEMEELR
jgi:hypothetical protein